MPFDDELRPRPPRAGKVIPFQPAAPPQNPLGNILGLRPRPRRAPLPQVRAVTRTPNPAAREPGSEATSTTAALAPELQEFSRLDALRDASIIHQRALDADCLEIALRAVELKCRVSGVLSGAKQSEGATLIVVLDALG